MKAKRPYLSVVLMVILFAVAGIVGVRTGRVATFTTQAEAESGTLAGGSSSVQNTAASGGRAVRFNAAQPTGTAVKAIDSANRISDPNWFNQAYAAGFRLYVPHTTSWGTCNVWPEAEAHIRNALNAGLKVAAYTRDPRCWRNGILAAGPYVNQLQFFCLDVETDPGVRVTREMVDGVKSLGVRPVIYSGYGMWPGVMGGNNTSFADVPLWDTNVFNFNFSTWQPNLLAPAPVAYGGWNTPQNMRIGIQQQFEYNFNGVYIDLNSFSADFLR
jgi:hypothetical protein